MQTSVRQRFETTQRFIEETILAEAHWLDLSAATAFVGAPHAAAGLFMLPALVCEAVGGDWRSAIPLAAGWQFFYLAAQLFDDLQDGDAKSGPWQGWPVARLLSVGTGALFAAEICLGHLRVSAETHTDIHLLLTRTGLLAARAQATEQTEPTLPEYFQNIAAKTGLLFAAIVQAGARLATSEPAILSAMHDFGLNLGLLTQLHDDLRDLAPTQPDNDLIQRRHTLPLLYALAQVSHPLHPELTRALHSADGAVDARRLYELLYAMEAIHFCLSVAHVYKQKAYAALSLLPTEKTIHLTAYVAQIFPPNLATESPTSA